MTWTTTADSLSLGLCDDGEVVDAGGRVVAGLRGDKRHAEADRAALALYFELAPKMERAAWASRWPRVRAAARKVLDTDNNGLRAGVLTADVVRAAALR